MEYYILDDAFRRSQLIEDFQSFIWTERYSASGDFQIVTQSTLYNRTLLQPETWIWRLGSRYVMKIDTVTDDTAEDGTRNLTVTGSSLEALLDDRVAMPSLSDTTTLPSWVLTGTPGGIVREMFNQICVLGALDEKDTIPFYTLGTLFPAGSIPEPADVITTTTNPDTLYNTIKSICDTYGLGFRLVRNGETSQVYFEVYTGNDLTSGQNTLPAVIFDPNLDNLEEISQLSSTAVVKTVAYVLASNGFAVVNAPSADPNATDFSRRVLLVNSSNDDTPGSALDEALQQEGLIALAAQRTVYSFDGTLPTTSQYVYGTDYQLGDLVEERNSDGFAGFMTVTEQIFSSDSTGETQYPTLSLSETVIPGSWLAFDQQETWDEVDPTLVWSAV
jgi:hypothetical protein